MANKSIIAGREVSNDIPPYIIAEMSANHNGNIDNAFKRIYMVLVPNNLFDANSFI